MVGTAGKLKAVPDLLMHTDVENEILKAKPTTNFVVVTLKYIITSTMIAHLKST